MDRRSCMCLPFGSVAGRALPRWDGACDTATGRWVLPRRGAGWVLPRPSGFHRSGASGYYRGSLLLIIVLSLAQRPFCRPSPRESCDVSKTINIITYTDVCHDGGVVVLRDCMGRMGLEGEGVDTSL